MKKINLASSLMAAIIMTGCASHGGAQFGGFNAQDLNAQLKSGQLVQKTDNFFVINDSSSSMTETYLGVGYPAQPKATKFQVEKELLTRLNQTLPDLKLSTGIRSFGFGQCLSYGQTKLNLATGTYSQSYFDQGIGSLDCASGGSPLHKAFQAVGKDLSPMKGSVALLVLSDGATDEFPLPEIETLKQQFGDTLCIYGIWVGNPDQQNGKATMAALSDAANCGFTVSADELAQPQAMADFVKTVFLKKGQPIDGDDDQDGVPNSRDRCPNTPRGATVDRHGCWAITGINFDFDQSVIKPEFYPLLDKTAHVIEQNPSLHIEVQGHTDSKGSDAYNLKLSERRAHAVRNYLAEKTGRGAYLTARGYGETRPIDSNETEQGRYNNRRVQLKITHR
ncbi:MAG: OmpA family protein [Methylococcales bacterium]|nr:OmpA family protein [Methylococcales bacterium]